MFLRKSPRKRKSSNLVFLYVDGASLGNPGPSGAGGVVLDSEGRELLSYSVPLGYGTNNEAEYKSLIIGLKKVLSLGFRRVAIKSDSQLLVRQINGDYKVKARGLVPLYLEAKKLLSAFEKWSVEHIPREMNKRADALSKRAAEREGEAGLSPRKGEESPGSRGQGAG